MKPSIPPLRTILFTLLATFRLATVEIYAQTPSQPTDPASRQLQLGPATTAKASQGATRLTCFR